METIKQTRVKRNGNKLILTLPETFKAEEVDVLIWPSDKENALTNESLSNHLLEWPQMSDEELSYINEKRRHLNAWK